MSKASHQAYEQAVATSEPAEPAAAVEKSPEFYKERAKKAAAARWEGRDKWTDMPLLEAERKLAEMRAELERATEIVRRRLTVADFVKCDTCSKEIANGRWAQVRTRHDFDTGLPVSIYFCSARCISLFNQKTQGTLDLIK